MIATEGKSKNEKGKRVASFFFLLPFTFFLASFAYAQGILPPRSGSNAAAPKAEKYLLIGEHVPDSINVIDINGKTRSLVSFKTSLDVLVVGFFSPSCTTNVDGWKALKRFYETYKEWHVAFVGVSATPNERLSDLADAITKAGLSYPVVRDERQTAAAK